MFLLSQAFLPNHDVTTIVRVSYYEHVFSRDVLILFALRLGDEVGLINLMINDCLGTDLRLFLGNVIWWLMVETI